MSFLDFIVPCIAAFLACIGFSLIYNIHGKNIVIASLCGALSWGVYYVVDFYSSSLVMPYFISGLAIALYSEIAAILFRAPITVYLILGIIPLVPGLTIYRTMESCLSSDLTLFGEGLLKTLKIGGAIALGLILMSSAFRLFKQRKS